MASTAYTLQTLQDRIHTLVENDPTTPSTTDDEWAIRYRLICQAINNWDSEDVYWNELWKPLATPITVVAGQTTYPLTSVASDFVFAGSYIKVTDPANSNSYQYLEVIENSDLTKLRDNTHSVYFTGNQGSGYTMNLGFTPATGDGFTGMNITFNYYKSSLIPISVTDVNFTPEMSNPDYIIYWVASQKHLMDGNTNQYEIYSNLADNCLEKMKIFNETKPVDSSNKIDDVELIRNNASFGW